ncbi:hypothetical protein PENTCL1PPCAC_22763, partial [Pristionchus entomophagus]
LSLSLVQIIDYQSQPAFLGLFLALRAMSMASTLCKLDGLSRKIHERAQLRTHKFFRVAVPGAVTGANLVTVVGESGQTEDEVEAAHLATLLLQFGYLFPVIEDALTVREDGTLYRLQRPYFWPSHATHADNVEYAIYLNKRLLRNEQKHGLEEDEAQHYNKLAELLAHIWEFITVQAELQLKQQKEKKKADKVVYDSEERAFWRRRRPGSANYLEEHIQKTERRLRKENAQGYKAKIERIKLSLKTKPWLKAIKASDTMVQWVEKLEDYDPFLSPTNPPNPWISDDCSLWLLNTDTVEVPTERRVKRWGLSVHELVKDCIGRQVLETFLESEFSSENIRFWIAIQDLKYAKNEEIESKAERIYEEFLAPGAPCQVNVDQRTLARTIECLESSKNHRHAFFFAEEHVFTLMSKDSYPRFVRSNIYKGVLSAAQQQGSRRLGWRNFVFNMGATKKMPLGNKQTKMSREDTAHASLPKQLSSDSLPVKQLPSNNKSGEQSTE